MQEICPSGSMRGVWKRSHGQATKAPPDERGGNRHARPNATAPHSYSTDTRRSEMRRSLPGSVTTITAAKAETWLKHRAGETYAAAVNPQIEGVLPRWRLRCVGSRSRPDIIGPIRPTKAAWFPLTILLANAIAIWLFVYLINLVGSPSQPQASVPPHPQTPAILQRALDQLPR